MEVTAAHILVVDDIESNRRLLARIIASPEYRLDFAADGQEALTRLAADDYDLVIVDIMMPILNGYEMLTKLKADEKLRHIPVIVISALSDMDTVVRCIEVGAEDYLTKPFNRILLQARIAASLEKKRLRDREQEYMQVVQNEMQIAQRIQADFLPRELPQLQGWDIATAFRPAHQVAGDLYDAFALPGGRIGLVVADVCDKGIGAALFMALVRTLVRVFAEMARPDPGIEHGLARATLGALSSVRRTNDYLIEHHIRSNMFASLFFGVLDPERCSLAYVNAGHDPPFVIEHGQVRERLTKTGPAVGTLRGAEYSWRETHFEPGTLLLCYTDGVTDARDASGAFYTDRRLASLAMSCAESATAAEIVAAVERDVSEFAGSDVHQDDVTLLAVRRNSVDS